MVLYLKLNWNIIKHLPASPEIFESGNWSKSDRHIQLTAKNESASMKIIWKNGPSSMKKLPSMVCLWWWYCIGDSSCFWTLVGELVMLAITQSLLVCHIAYTTRPFYAAWPSAWISQANFGMTRFKNWWRLKYNATCMVQWDQIKPEFGSSRSLVHLITLTAENKRKYKISCDLNVQNVQVHRHCSTVGRVFETFLCRRLRSNH